MVNHNKIFLFSLLFISLLSFSVFSDSNEFTYGWNMYQSNIGSYGVYTGEDGTYSGTSTEYYSAAGVNSVQPLLVDLNNDDQKEIIISNGNNVNIYNIDSGVYTLKGSIFVTSHVNQSMMVYNDFDSNNFPELFVVNNGVYVIEWNNTASAYYLKQSNTGMTKSDTGIKCFNNETCVYGNYNCSITEYNPLGNNYTNLQLGGAAGCLTDDTTGSREIRKTPVIIEEFYGDGHVHFAFYGDYEADNQDSIILYDSFDDSLETSFSSNGILEDADACSGSVITHLSSFSSNGVKLFALTQGFGGCAGDSRVDIIDNTGAITQTSSIYSASGYRGLGSLVIGDFVNDSRQEYCGFAWKTDATNNIIKCFDISSYEQVYSSGLLGKGYLFKTTGTCTTYANCVWPNVIGAKVLTNTTSKLQMIAGGHIFQLVDGDSAIIYNLTNTAANRQYSSMSTSDVNDDSLLDVCSVRNGRLSCYFSGYSNQAPELNDRDFGQNYVTPLCLGTTVTYTATECGTGSCHYTNDVITEQERLVSDCGTGTSANGTYSLSSPTFACTFNSLGNFNFNIYLQDKANDDDLTVYRTKNIYVVNGTAGVDCNLPVSVSILEGDNLTTTISTADQITSEAELLDTIEIVTGQSTFIKLLLVTIFSAALLLFFATRRITNPIVYAVGIFTLWILFSLLGLMSWIYPLLFGVVIGGITIAIMILGGSNNGGE